MDVVGKVGAKIRQLRASSYGSRFTQEELSEKAEISVSFLSMIERGERAPHLETLARIAAALEVPLEELFNFNGLGAEKMDPLFRPLAEFCRKQKLSKRDVDKLLAVARALYSD